MCAWKLCLAAGDLGRSWLRLHSGRSGCALGTFALPQAAQGDKGFLRRGRVTCLSGWLVISLCGWRGNMLLHNRPTAAAAATATAAVATRLLCRLGLSSRLRTVKTQQVHSLLSC